MKHVLFPVLFCACLANAFGQARGADPAPIVVDNFERASEWTLSADSMGAVRVVNGVGVDGSNALLFETSASPGRVGAWRTISHQAGFGVEFDGRAIQGQASLNIRLIEADGDVWSAWTSLDSEWIRIGLPLSEFEFLRRGDGRRQLGAVRRLEVIAVMRGAESEQRCLIDNIAMVHPDRLVSRRGAGDRLARLLAEADRLALSKDPRFAAWRARMASLDEASETVRWREAIRTAGSALASALDAATNMLPPDGAETGEPADHAGRVARLAQAHARPYLARLGELVERDRQFGLSVDEIEDGLVYARRALEFARESQAATARTLAPDGTATTRAPEQLYEAAGAMRRVRLLLNGEWKARPGGSMDRPPLDDWRPMHVPHGLWGRSLGPGFTPFDSGDGPRHAWFRRTVAIPEAWRGRRVALRFEGAGHWIEVFVNGRPCGGSIGGLAPFEVDVTGAVRPGQANDIAVLAVDSRATQCGPLAPEVARGVYAGVNPGPGPNFYLSMNGPGAVNAGLWDDVWIEAGPFLRIRRLAVRTSVQEELLEAQVEIVNETQRERAVRLECAVLDEGAPVVGLMPQDIRLGPGETRVVSVRQPWAGYSPWGPGPPYGTPKLYWLAARLFEDGASVDELRERFGFREFRIHDGGFELNGHPIRLQGDTLSVSEGGLTWERANPGYFAQYLRLARSANVNFLRLRSGAPRAWLDLCDEAGMLCAPEATVGGLVSVAPPDLHGLDDYRDPLWIMNAERQVSDWARGLLNHPSVIFSIPDGGSFGEDLFWAHGGGAPSQARKSRQRMEAAFDLRQAIRRVDPTRAAIFLDTADMDADPRFEVCSWVAPQGLENWRQRARGRPVITEIRLPKSREGRLPSFEDLRLANRDQAGDALERLSDWMRSAIEKPLAEGASAIFIPNLQAGLFSTARRDLMGPWSALTAQSLTEYPQILRDSGAPLANVDFSIPIEWPALSGLGQRPASFELAADVSTWINWFEPKTPAATPNRLYASIREAFPSVNFAEIPRQRTECVLDFGPSGAGVAVYVSRPGEWGGQKEGTMTDAQGRAWLTLRDTGSWIIEAPGALPPGGVSAALEPTPPLPERPGYWHIPVFRIRGGGMYPPSGSDRAGSDG